MEADRNAAGSRLEAQMSPSGHSNENVSGKVVQGLAGLAIGIAAAVLAGWMTDRMWLATWGADFIPMAPSTALMVLLLGLGLMARFYGSASRLSRGFSIGTAIIIATISGVLLIQFPFGSDCGLETFLVNLPETLGKFGGQPAGHMSPVTAIGMLISSLALLVLQWVSVRRQVLLTWAATLALTATVIGFVVTLGYAYGTPLFYDGSIIPIALPTGLALLLLGSGLVTAAGPSAWPLRCLAGPAVSARLMRIFLPVVLFIVLIDNWLRRAITLEFGEHPVAWISGLALVFMGIAFAIITMISRTIGGTIDQKESELRVSEQKFSSIFHNNPQLMAISSLENSQLLEVNEAWLRTMGFQRDEVIGRTSQELGLFIDKNWRDEALRILQEHGTFRDLEAKVRTRDGRIRHGLISADIIQVQGQSLLLTVMTDITERRQMEERAERLSRIFEDSINEVYIFDSETFRFQQVNRSALRNLGYTMEEMLFLTPLDLKPELTPETFKALIGPLLCGINDKVIFYTHHRRKDGSMYPVEVHLQPSTHAGHRFFVAIILDITERQRIAEKLQESERKYRELVENANSIILRLTSDGRISFMNEFGQKFFGYSAEEIIGRHAVGTIVPENETSGRNLRPLINAVCADPQQFEHNINENMRRDGERVWIVWTNKAVRNVQGEVKEILSIGSDITEIKKAETALQESEQRFRLVLEGSQLGFWDWDLATREVKRNERWATMLGYTLEEIQSSVAQWTDLIHPDDRAAAQVSIDDHLQGRTPMHRVEYRMRAKDGQYHWILDQARVMLRDPQGKPLRMCGTHTDITERKRVEEELIQHREHLEEQVLQRTAELAEARDLALAANRAKSAFLANMSHELRTPLNAVLGFAQIMSADRTISAQAKDNLSIILRSGEHLLSLINDILDLSKIEAGRSNLDLRDVDLNLLIHDVAGMMQLKADAKGLRLRVEQSSGFPRFARLDPGKFRQILVNLVGNGIKFTEAGQVTIKLDARPGPDGNLLDIEVRDTGIGIARSDFELVFRPFEQIGTKMTDGTGLGLTITRQYVQMMGGEISVDSELGKGSCFRFAIPVGGVSSDGILALSGHRQPVGIGSPTAGIRLLIVEDQPENRLLIHCFLEPFGFQLREAADGQAAVAAFQEWHPHMIFMDRRMPVMDGIEATQKIRSLPGGRETIIVAVSAHSFKEEQQEMLDTGCDDFLGKPFGLADLLALLQRHLHLNLVYGETVPAAPVNHRSLSSADLQSLPVPVLVKLRRWTLEAQADDLVDWVNGPNGLSPEVRQVLIDLLQEYRFEILAQVIEPLIPPEIPTGQ